MRMSLALVLACWVLCALAPVGAAPVLPSASWQGLVGLYTHPTAETLPNGSTLLNFSEIRFSQRDDGLGQQSIWYYGTLTVVPAARWEVTVGRRHEIVRSENPLRPELNDHQNIGNVKYVILPTTPRHIGVAAGVLDITGATQELDGQNTDRGQRYYLVGSYEWAHFGVTHDRAGVGIYAGARWTLTDNVEVIAEWVSRPLFVKTIPPPSNGVNFNLGVRLHPREVPQLHIDAVAVGDGRFDYGFAIGYQLR